jgi:chaperonin GroES
MAKNKKTSGINFVPGANKFLIRKQDAVTEVNGIYIPETNREKPMEGKVIAANSQNRENLYVVGDHILFGKYSGVEVVVDGVDYLILQEDEILGKRL